MRIHRIIHQLLHRFITSEERFALLRHAILKANKSLHIIIHEVTQLGLQHDENADTYLPLEYREIEPDELLALQKLAVERIEFWVHMGRLIEHPKLLPILYAWRAWGNESECKNYIKHITQEDVGLRLFLCAALKGAIDQAMLKYEINFSREKYLENISHFIDPKLLEMHAKTMFEDIAFERLNEREQLGLMIFLDLMGTETTKEIPKTLP